MKKVMITVMFVMVGSQAACLESDGALNDTTIHSDVKEVGQNCELAVGCGAGLRCDPVIDDGKTIGAVCLVAQGETCNPDYDLCGRGLACKELTEDSGDFMCLPGGCIDDSECSDGKVCHNFQCFEQTTCSQELSN